jgi:hypothetical protein
MTEKELIELINIISKTNYITFDKNDPDTKKAFEFIFELGYKKAKSEISKLVEDVVDYLENEYTEEEILDHDFIGCDETTCILCRCRDLINSTSN